MCVCVYKYIHTCISVRTRTLVILGDFVHFFKQDDKSNRNLKYIPVCNGTFVDISMLRNSAIPTAITHTLEKPLGKAI